MYSIEHLRTLVGLSGRDELLIAQSRPQLEAKVSAWRTEYEQWLHKAMDWEDGGGPLLKDFLYSFVCGTYGEDFFAVQYQQAIRWLRAGVDNGHSIAALSRVRQFFIGIGETRLDPEVPRALCRVVDVAQAIHGMVSHLGETLRRLRAAAEQDIARLQQGCEVIASNSDNGLLQAYTDHYLWKVRAYSLALGDPVAPEEVPMSPKECDLGRWLDARGLALIPTEERVALLAAHDRLHALMAVVLGQARQQRPQCVADYLLDVEVASEEISQVLGRCIEREMRAIAVLDLLTGLANRRLFEQELQRREAYCRRSHKGFGLLFMDLDYFKKINDELGHQAGDKVLQGVASRLKEVLRGSDAVYRWGGEEFAALVHAESAAEVRRTAERVRRMVRSSPIDAESRPVQITLSIGGSYCGPVITDNGETLFKRADLNLHRAKAEGRDRVVVS
jgi:diguanylate cyclase (GGDEF)-like protein